MAWPKHIFIKKSKAGSKEENCSRRKFKNNTFKPHWPTSPKDIQIYFLHGLQVVWSNSVEVSTYKLGTQNSLYQRTSIGWKDWDRRWKGSWTINQYVFANEDDSRQSIKRLLRFKPVILALMRLIFSASVATSRATTSCAVWLYSESWKRAFANILLSNQLSPRSVSGYCSIIWPPSNASSISEI